ncbi:phage holin family protein [Sporomusa malonica]|uniref:Putative membrane protein n=1 Tax=Sporomusa malonica TaxID=112901 RepID=A0A1W1YX67_9FIRM|nr:phage holin family protein [Sporomusa malonica]SMC40744.1 putative membrane protein [Sporomusa malonica]
MSGFLLRIIINAVILIVVVTELPGVFVDTLGGTLLGAAIVGLANAAIRPMLAIAALPFDMLTLGSITVMTNIFTPLMVVKALPGFQISGAVTLLTGILLMTLCSFTLSKVIHDR